VPLVFALLVIVVLFVLLWKLRDGEGPPRRPGGTGRASRGRSTPRPPRPTRSVGPDDDPDFLRELDRRARPPGEEPDK
jgi:hypothetical protein